MNDIPSIKDRCFAEILNVSTGLTCDEIATKLGLTIINVKPKLGELVSAGFIKDSGERRKNQYGVNSVIWIATPS